MPVHPFRGTSPFFLLSIACFAGHAAALAAWGCWGAVAALFGLLSLFAAVFKLPGRVTAVAVTLLCGALSAGRTGYVDPSAARPFLDNEVIFRGTVDSVQVGDSGWRCTADDVTVSMLDNSASLRLKKAIVFIRNPGATASFPSELRATGRLHPIRSMNNPGEMPREWEVLASGAQYAFSADSSKAILLPCSRTGSLFPGAREQTGRWLTRVTGNTEGGLYLLSLANGQVPPPSHPLVLLFRRTGLAHLFAISGVNVVIFYAMHAAIVRGFIWLFRRRRGTPDLNRIASLASLPVCWAYVLMAGAPVPAVRSAGMITVAVLLWNLLGLRGAGFGFSLLFFMTVATSPFSVLTPSFLLSYGAVFFLIAAAGAAEEKDDAESGQRKGLGVIIRWILLAIEASAVAFFGTLPVSAAFFQGMPLGSILWNVLFGPLLGAGGVAGAFLAVLGGVFRIRLLEYPVRLISEGLGWCIEGLRYLSGNGIGYFRLPPSGPVSMLLVMAVSATGALWLRSKGRRAWPAPVFGALLFLAWIHLPYAALPDSRMSLTALNVGKGASHVIGFPGGGIMVLDCGSALRGDAGNRILLPYLRSIGATRIALLVLSHPHEDHFGGALALINAMPVDEIWLPEGVSPDRFGPAVAAYRGRIRRVGRGDNISVGGARVTVRSAGDGSGPGANGQSLVIEARYGRFAAWLPGDVEGGPAAWGAVSKRYGEWCALFLPHHGSPGAAPQDWTAAAKPEVAVLQNRNCLARKNLITSGKIFALEEGALTFLTDGSSVVVDQDHGFGLLRFLCRLSG